MAKPKLSKVWETLKNKISNFFSSEEKEENKTLEESLADIEIAYGELMDLGKNATTQKEQEEFDAHLRQFLCDVDDVIDRSNDLIKYWEDAIVRNENPVVYLDLTMTPEMVELNSAKYRSKIKKIKDIQSDFHRYKTVMSQFLKEDDEKEKENA